ncbi:glycine betaine ABC transporter substrate-binding protein OsmF [Limimaricola pyoseonensis]|uniref:Osmoprotectant transport system substrate-binding protein n=1 Tax=Limimaricola pyoseonensis TaxID=521013 RepID=A0A1G7KFB2_9RHOB|nr:ABC transporter substrate-binding protein [Limimaricola pyoseonensis]SDF35751.1 osmoprotectant transport system substrate-binding protein [Limimaricola pyoseonensis]
MRRLLALAAATTALTATAASADLVVGSKIDTEGNLLGNMIKLVLEDAGIAVEDRISLGATPIVRQAITSGEIDIYPEYTGNGAFFFDQADSEVWRDAKAGYQQVAKLDAETNDIVWLSPAPANNTWAIALREEVADENGLVTMSDLGTFLSEGGQVTLAASSEFVNSEAALPAFQAAYGFEMSNDQLVILSGGDTAATIRAAAEQIDGANAAMVYGTDGAIAEVGLKVMEDDKSVQPVYQPAPIIRRAALEENPQVEELLAPVFAGLDLETLQSLNARIQLGGESAQAVAEDYLTSEGLID